MRAMMVAFVALGGAAWSPGAAQALERAIDADASLRAGARDFSDAMQRFLERSQPKIVQGTPAPAGAHPWQAALLVSQIGDPAQAGFCGAAILEPTWLVTAAHCVHALAPLDLHVVVGETTIEHGARRANAARFIIHSAYDPATQDNDIALIETFEPLPLSETAKPVAPLTAAEEAVALDANARLTITGWGLTSEGGERARRLMQAQTPFVSREACNDLLSYRGAVTENMLCAGEAAGGGSDACQGDSGGPMTLALADGQIRLAGLVSWGEGCARPGKYGVYTRVSRYEDWIRACMQGAEGCR